MFRKHLKKDFIRMKPCFNLRYFVLAISLLVPVVESKFELNADVRLPNIFTDNMVLQQQSKNTIWGWAESGEKIKVVASWGTLVTTEADSEGRWKLFLETPGVGTGHSLKVSGKNTLNINNVAIGEVWLCAGQSNMGWSTGNSFEAEKEANIHLPDFRIFKSQREHWHEPLEASRDRLQQWKPCQPASAAETSAVAYYFGKTLHLHLDIPIGIIVQAYAGTPIEGWMPWDIQKKDARALEHKKALDQNAARRIARGETIENALETYAAELSQYHSKINAGETMKNVHRALQPPFITKPASLGHQYPGHIFNAMIHPIRPYGIRGIIWYQGERNAKNVPQAYHYRHQLKQLIQYYRASWNNLSHGNVAPDFPFQFTQLPSWGEGQSLPVEDLEAPWAVSRESMQRVEKELDATGMVVSIDTGDAIQLHPKNKKPLGMRHAYLALQQTYGKVAVATGPRYMNHQIHDGGIVIRFDSIGSGLFAARPGALGAFAIAGEDRQWHKAHAVILGEAIRVSSADVANPVAVRYAWAMNPSKQNLLYNREGFPASPFRTDDWPLFDTKRPLVQVVKPAKPDGYEATDWDRPSMKIIQIKSDRQEDSLLEQRSDSNQLKAALMEGEYFISQSWSQEQDFKRSYHVSIPKGEAEKWPLFIFLHGNGGQGKQAMNGFKKRHAALAEKYILVFPDGYQKSWNIVSERSKADDRGFIEDIINHLSTYANVQKEGITLMGSSNGAALVNQIAIETRLKNIRNYITAVSPLNGFQHDSDHFKSKGSKNDYTQVATPLRGKRLLNISGTKDRLVPYHGGPSSVIPAKGGKLTFVDAEESIFRWANAMGYKGSKKKHPNRITGNLEVFEYLGGNIMHVKVNGEGHGATRAITTDFLMNFLKQ